MAVNANLLILKMMQFVATKPYEEAKMVINLSYENKSEKERSDHQRNNVYCQLNR